MNVTPDPKRPAAGEPCCISATIAQLPEKTVCADSAAKTHVRRWLSRAEGECGTAR